MSWGRRGTAEECRQAEALNLLANRVVLGLLGESRHTGGFGEDEEVLQARAEELAERHLDSATDLGDVSVRLKLRKGGRIELTVGEEEGLHVSAEVREDGYVLGGSTGRRGPVVVTKPEDMEPWERQEIERDKLAREASRGKPTFHGKVHLRTVAAPAQPDAALRILAAELYADGLVVDFTYDTKPPSAAEIGRMRTPRPPMRIADDLGTEYYEGERATYGGSEGGAGLSHFTFAPAVPTAARTLRIVTDSGTVELDLQL